MMMMMILLEKMRDFSRFFACVATMNWVVELKTQSKNRSKLKAEHTKKQIRYRSISMDIYLVHRHLEHIQL